MISASNYNKPAAQNHCQAFVNVVFWEVLTRRNEHVLLSVDFYTPGLKSFWCLATILIQ